MAETRIATLGIVEEMRSMKVGDVVKFPLSVYNYSSVRATPSGPLLNERVNEGKRWKTRVNYIDKCVDVTRTA